MTMYISDEGIESFVFLLIFLCFIGQICKSIIVYSLVEFIRDEMFFKTRNGIQKDEFPQKIMDEKNKSAFFTIFLS